MMKRTKTLLLVASLCPFLLGVCLAQTHEQKQWTWKDGKGKPRTKVELLTLLQKHLNWLNATTFDGMCADKSGLLLWSRSPLGTNLVQAEIYGDGSSFSPLSGADLRCANLSGVDLSGTVVDGANLRGAYLRRAKLKKTTFNNSNLQGVIFDEAEMQEAVLSGVITGLDLTEASFISANLASAIMMDIDLGKAQFAEADLLNVHFEPKTLPLVRSISSAKNLESLRYRRNPDALTLLRVEFKNAGFREQERKVTYALKRLEAERYSESCAISLSGVLACIYAALNTLLFDWTVHYGMSPGRMFVAVGSILIVSAVLYDLFLHFSESSGLLVLVPQGSEESRPKWLRAYMLDSRTYNAAGSASRREYRISSRQIKASTLLSKVKRFLKREWVLFWLAFVFSMMSTFNIKFRDIDFGRWLRSLTTTEYEIRATGWARTLSGLQALVSVYFVSLGVVSYFLRPFE